MSVTARLPAEEVIRRAVAFFAGEQGMNITSQSPTCAYFEGAGGTVEVVACADKDCSSVELTSTEWEIQVRQFAEKLQ